LTATAAFNLQWPAYLERVFNTMTTVGESFESYISFDCFLSDSKFISNSVVAGFSGDGQSTFYFKSIVISISPIICILLLVAYFYVRMNIVLVSRNSFKREVTTSVLVILYLIHPSITRYALSLYYCMELDEGETWLYRDL